MSLNFASALILIILVATIVPPGYPAYIGVYVSLAAAIIALIYGWRDRVIGHPTAIAILIAIGLVTLTVPFVYRGPTDLLAPVLILPMLTTIALGSLARRASWVPSVTTMAGVFLFAVFIAFAGVLYQRYAMRIYRPGLGNNPIHFATLAALSGCMAMLGVTASTKPWRYVFLLGPVFGLGTAIVADLRGPMVGTVAMSAVGFVVLTVWLWRETLFRYALAACVAIAAAAAAYFISAGNARVAGIFDTALNIFQFTGTTDDVRAALYASAVETLKASPIVGSGLGQIMDMAKARFPEQRHVLTLDNLHADWANFAAMAGGAGLVAWLLLLVAPLALLLNEEHEPIDR